MESSAKIKFNAVNLNCGYEETVKAEVTYVARVDEETKARQVEAA